MCVYVRLLRLNSHTPGGYKCPPATARQVVKLTALSFVRYIEAHADANLENVRAQISRARGTRDCAIPTADGTKLNSYLYRPDADGKFPVILGVCAYSLDDQIAPIMPVGAGGIRGHMEAGDPNFYVSRGYVHVILNVRGTGKSEGYLRFSRPPRNSRYLRRHRMARQAGMVQRQGRHVRPVVFHHGSKARCRAQSAVVEMRFCHVRSDRFIPRSRLSRRHFASQFSHALDSPSCPICALRIA